MNIYGDTLTMPKPVYGIDSKKGPWTLDSFEIEKPGFEKRDEEVGKIPMDFVPYGNNNVVAMMRRMNYLPGMNLGRAVKKPTVQDLAIPIATPPFGQGYKPIDDDLLEMEVRKMAQAKAKAKAKGLQLSSRTFETLHSYIEWEVRKSWRKSTLLGIP